MNRERGENLRDVLIIGQGLAGTALAWELLQRKFSLDIIDLSASHLVRTSSASMVAAGLVTSFTGKRFQQSWNWEHAFGAADRLYRQCEVALGARFWEKLPAVRIATPDVFDSVLHAKAQTDSGECYCYTSPRLTDFNTKNFSSDRFFIIEEAAKLSVNQFIEKSRDYFRSQNIFFEVDYDVRPDLIVRPDQACETTFKTVDALSLSRRYRYILFAEGASVGSNPWFSEMDLELSAGDILTVRIPGLNLRYSVHDKIWITPMQSVDLSGESCNDNLYLVGSTYRWNNVDHSTDASNAEPIITNLQSMVRLPFDVVDHRVGIRPASFDHKPMIGQHSEYLQLGIINGLGTKGVLYAPWCAKLLIDSITGETQNGQQKLIDVLNWKRRRKRQR